MLHLGLRRVRPDRRPGTRGCPLVFLLEPGVVGGPPQIKICESRLHLRIPHSGLQRLVSMFSEADDLSLREHFLPKDFSAPRAALPYTPTEILLSSVNGCQFEVIR